MTIAEPLQNHRQYQESVYGYDFAAMQKDAEARTEYATWNILAAINELNEALAEIPWKPWADDDKAETWAKNRDKFVGELIDVQFFLNNLFLAAGVDDSEFDEKFLAKSQKNKSRQERDGGYKAQTNGCPSCRRELDREGATYEHEGYVICTACNATVTPLTNK